MFVIVTSGDWNGALAPVLLTPMRMQADARDSHPDDRACRP
jgi:hypothetical protein